MDRPCIECCATKPLEAFPKTKSTTTGKVYVRHKCKACIEAVRTEWRRNNAAHIAAVRKAWRDTSELHKSNRNEKHKSWRDKNVEHVRTRAKVNELRRLYGLSPADVAAMLVEQGGVCAACAGPPNDDRPFMVDHNHVTGAVRGLLCNSCNLTLGTAKEDMNRLRGLIEYIARCEPEKQSQAPSLRIA